MSKIAIITGSTRMPRVGTSVSNWVLETLKSRPTAGQESDLELVPVEIADYKLPIFDESVIPASVPEKAQFQHEHSKRWSGAIKSFAGYIFVVPEYNFGVAGGYKNAIDYLYHEWIGKPVVVVSYGIQGGKTASAQLSGILEAMKLRVAPTKIQLDFPGGVGPELFGAMNKGILGEDTKKSWNEAAVKDELFKGWIEFVGLLKEKAKEDAQAAKN